MADFSIIIPARNEEQNLFDTVSKLIDTIKLDFEIIIINDHSLDRTKEVAEDFSASYSNVKVYDNPSIPGFVNAIRCGIGHVKTEFFIPVMADLCDDPNTIVIMLEKMKQGYDIVAGSRYCKGGLRLGGFFIKAFLSRFTGKTLHLLIGIPTCDIPNAFKMYRRSIIDEKCLRSRGFEISVEMPVKAYFRGAKITEVPTIWRERKAGTSHFKLFNTGKHYIVLYLWAIFEHKKLCFIHFFIFLRKRLVRLLRSFRQWLTDGPERRFYTKSL